ncbi:conserved hypothetical protein [Lebetimonas natsushimae]|uniref:Uncharacterized protein n=1 Tax=Lebetimonas natsushimae TaxID=1936991 RepID=A0A292YDU0_9BACT|nr:hypothetical protein [Lebetimonas natsushimae]GAX87354.1 conserved hypothetical protein [Lebetimonas natsushimae]
MQYVITAVGFIVGFIVKFGIQKFAMLPVKFAAVTFTAVAITLYIGSYILFADFIFNIITKFYDLLDSINNLSVGSGNVYGITLSSIWNAFLGFLNASGVGPAFTNAFNLFLVLYFSYYAVIIAKTVAHVYRNVVDMINNSLQMFD